MKSSVFECTPDPDCDLVELSLVSSAPRTNRLELVLEQSPVPSAS